VAVNVVPFPLNKIFKKINQMWAASECTVCYCSCILNSMGLFFTFYFRRRGGGLLFQHTNHSASTAFIDSHGTCKGNFSAPHNPNLHQLPEFAIRPRRSGLRAYLPTNTEIERATIVCRYHMSGQRLEQWRSVVTTTSDTDSDDHTQACLLSQ